MYLIGLTGSIGMGKTLTASLFEAAGVPRYDADAAIHALYAPGGDAVAPVAELFPDAIVDGAVDRGILGQLVLKDADKLKQLEALVHPLAGASQMAFLAKHAEAGAPMALLDIPLLYETGGDGFVDCVVVVSAPYEVQRARVLERPGMSEEKFLDILAKQVPDDEKRRRADFIVDSSVSVEDARRQIHDILATLEGREGTALEARRQRYEQRSASTK
ncbi:MAG: dephospho-CoA kinase [Parvibaculales bacterium]